MHARLCMAHTSLDDLYLSQYLHIFSISMRLREFSIGPVPGRALFGMCGITTVVCQADKSLPFGSWFSASGIWVWWDHKSNLLSAHARSPCFRILLSTAVKWGISQLSLSLSCSQSWVRDMNMMIFGYNSCFYMGSLEPGVSVYLIGLRFEQWVCFPNTPSGLYM